MIEKFIFGTAQIGMHYGINNKTVYSRKDAENLIKYSFEKGFRRYDTAKAYGEAEVMIGEILESNIDEVFITTKLNHNINNDIISANLQILESLKNMKCNTIECVMFHSYKDLLKSPDVIDTIQKFKDRGVIKSIGVSLYDELESEGVLKKFASVIDVVQLPFNLLDNRHQSYFKEYRDSNISVTTRSVFLQGVFFLPEKYLKESTKSYVLKLKEFSENLKIPIYEMALSYVINTPEISNVVVGFDSKTQIDEMKLFIENQNFNKKIPFDLISNEIGKPPLEVIDPRKW